MSTNFKSYLIIIFVFITNLFAGLITIDNNVYPIGEYTTLVAAHENAAIGDTIYVIPSLTDYEGIAVSKTLTFLGVGFELDLWPGQASLVSSSISGTMIFDEGSDGSILEGFDGEFNVSINTDFISVKRNLLYSINFYENTSSSIIIQNKIGGIIDDPGSSLQDVTFINNIINTMYFNDYDNTSGFHFINNNFISGSTLYLGSNSVLINNIFVSSNSVACVECIFSNNMWSGDPGSQYEGNGNMVNIDMNAVFINYSDGDYHLLPESPAIGSGQDGADMGIYGGEAPFIDGGFPGIPAIYELDVENVGSQIHGLDVIIRAKSNNE